MIAQVMVIGNIMVFVVGVKLGCYLLNSINSSGLIQHSYQVLDNSVDFNYALPLLVRELFAMDDYKSTLPLLVME